MTLQALRAVVLAAMTALGKTEAPAVPPSPLVAEAIAAAVFGDEEGRLTGSDAGDAVLGAVWSFHESRWGWQLVNGKWVRQCTEGDGGKAFGDFQLQTRREIGCDEVASAAYWLHWAHGSQHRCQSLIPDERLAQLASGTCARGHVVTRSRVHQAARLTVKIVAELG